MIKPLHGWVLLEPSEIEGKTRSGLFIPDVAKQKPTKGKVIDSGISVEISNGEIVFYHRVSVTSLEDDGKEFLIIKDTDILAKEI